MSDPKPTGLIANKGIELLTFGTPNGHKASIILEELKEAYGKDYTVQAISKCPLRRCVHIPRCMTDLHA